MNDNLENNTKTISKLQLFCDVFWLILLGSCLIVWISVAIFIFSFLVDKSSIIEAFLFLPLLIYALVILEFKCYVLFHSQYKETVYHINKYKKQKSQFDNNIKKERIDMSEFNKIEIIKKYKALLDSGAITSEEYENKKIELLK